MYIRQITLLSKAAVTVISKCLLHSLFTAQFLHYHSRLFATKRWSVSKNYRAVPLLPASTSLNQQKQAALRPFSDLQASWHCPPGTRLDKISSSEKLGGHIPLGAALPAAGEDAHGDSADVARLGFETVSHGMGGTRGSPGVAGRKAVIP